MTNAKPSVLLTYVTYHDDIAYEHTRLFKLLRILLGDADRDGLLKRNAEYLVEFWVCWSDTMQLKTPCCKSSVQAPCSLMCKPILK